MISCVVVFDGRVTEVVYDDRSVVARRDGYRESWDLCETFFPKKAGTKKALGPRPSLCLGPHAGIGPFV